MNLILKMFLINIWLPYISFDNRTAYSYSIHFLWHPERNFPDPCRASHRGYNEFSGNLLIHPRPWYQWHCPVSGSVHRWFPAIWCQRQFLGKAVESTLDWFEDESYQDNCSKSRSKHNQRWHNEFHFPYYHTSRSWKWYKIQWFKKQKN